MYYSTTIIPTIPRQYYDVTLMGEGNTLLSTQNGKPYEIEYEQLGNNKYRVSLESKSDFIHEGIIKIYKVPTLCADADTSFRERAEKIEALRLALTINVEVVREHRETGSDVDTIIEQYLIDKGENNGFYVENPGTLNNYEEIIAYIADAIENETISSLSENVRLSDKKYLILTRKKHNAIAVVGKNVLGHITTSKILSQQVRRPTYSIFFDNKALSRASEIFECDPIYATLGELEMTINACFNLSGCVPLTYSVSSNNSSTINLNGIREINPNWEIIMPNRAPTGQFQFGLQATAFNPVVASIKIEGEETDNLFESEQGSFPEVVLDDLGNEGKIVIEVETPEFAGAENLWPIMSDLSGLYSYNRDSWVRSTTATSIVYTSVKEYNLEEPIKIGWAYVPS